MSGTVTVAPVADQAAAAVTAAAPLAADLRLQVGPFVVPVGLLASPGRVEGEDSEAGIATRQFLRDDPFAGMGSVGPGGWALLLATTP